MLYFIKIWFYSNTSVIKSKSCFVVESFTLNPNAFCNHCHISIPKFSTKSSSLMLIFYFGQYLVLSLI